MSEASPFLPINDKTAPASLSRQLLRNHQKMFYSDIGNYFYISSCIVSKTFIGSVRLVSYDPYIK